MKKLLIALAILPISLYAQRWQIGIGSGVSVISAPDVALFNNSKTVYAPAIEFYGSKSLSPDIRAGLKVSVMNLLRNGNVTLVDSDAKATGVQQVDIYVGRPAIMVTPFLSYYTGEFHFGAQAGAVIFTGADDDKYTPGKFTLYYQSSKGFCAGAHAGYTHAIGDMLSVYARASGNYVTTTAVRNKYASPVIGQKLGQSSYSLNFLQAQLTVGLQLSIR